MIQKKKKFHVRPEGWRRKVGILLMSHNSKTSWLLNESALAQIAFNRLKNRNGCQTEVSNYRKM